MTCFRWSLTAIALAFWFARGGSSAQVVHSVQSSPPVVGVVRGDGTFLPLAARENDAWTDLRYYTVDGDRGVIKLRDQTSVPKEGWTYVPWVSGASRQLIIKGMVTTDAYCARQEGFATDAPKLAERLDAPHLMSGIAVHGHATAARAEDVLRHPDDASRRAVRFIVQLTHALESERASHPPRSAGRTIPSNDRGKVPVQITTLARDRIQDDEHYYFEARKRYGAVESYANGWLTSSPSSISVLRVESGIYAGGETARRRGRVLGVLRVMNRSVWVMEMRGYEGDSYDIVEMPEGQVLSVSGGGC